MRQPGDEAPVPPGRRPFAAARGRPDSGTASQATRKEIARLAAIVSERALKKAPVTPLRNASGAKMMIVDADDPANGRVNSDAAVETRPR